MMWLAYIAVTAVTLLGPAICQNSTSTSSAAYAISTDGNCGGTTNETCAGSIFGGCCSQHGFCGSTDSYCGSGCQDAFGATGACQGVNSSVSTTGSCGGSTGLTCVGSRWGNCCSSHGYCGNDSTYCGVGCQISWGECGSDAETNTTATNTTATNTTATNTMATNTMATASASPSASSSPSTSASPSAAPLFRQKTPVTQTTGFKAGISVIVVVLALISAIAIFLLRRRRTSAHAGHSYLGTGDGSAQWSELDAEKPLPMHPYVAKGNVELCTLPSELSAVPLPQELPAAESEKSRVAKVDERAAAGYDGAYRGK